MARLHRVAHRVVWVNPHRGKAGYEPVQQGVVAVLPHIDDFLAGHSLATYADSWRWSPVRDVLPELLAWWRAGETVGVGTVVATFQSAPRPAGASMLVGPDGTAVGSVSGGCVEGAVYELAESVVETGKPVLERYGVSDDDAFAVGLTCGGILDVYVEKVSRETFPELGEIAADIEAGRPVALATVIEHPDPAWLGRRIVVRPEGGPPAGARLGPRRRRGPGRHARAAGERAQRDADLRARRGAAGRGDAGVRVGVRAEAADAGVRGDRLRGRRSRGWAPSSATT